MRPELKPDDTPVTAADREAERLIRTRMRDEAPGTQSWGRCTGPRRGRARATAGSLAP
jgi:fructose-1,6-bisphosphatase/inositol monophosphatase family enzyme